MKRTATVIAVLGLLCLLLSACSYLGLPKSAASWAYAFVYYKSTNYIITKESVTDIGEKLGQIDHYSSQELNTKDYKYDIFSNIYQVGTELYAIKGIEPASALAVKTDGKYIKLVSAK